MRVLACLLAAVFGVAFAAFALVGVVTHVAQSQTDQQRAQRLADFGTLAYLIGRESRLVNVRSTDPAPLRRSGPADPTRAVGVAI